MLKVRMWLCLLLGVCLLAAGSPAYAGAQTSLAAPPGSLLPDQWTGQVFVFLDLPADRRAEGYEIFTASQAAAGLAGDRTVRLPYKAYTGKRVLVTDVVTYTASDHYTEYMIHMKVLATGEKLVGRTMRGQLEGLVRESDIANAKQQFIGKTIYVKKRVLPGIYNPLDGTTSPAVAVEIGQPVKVVDVYAGIQSNEPIWLIVEANGAKAMLPTAYSWTNIAPGEWLPLPPWQDDCWLTDPRLTLKWSFSTWQNIAAGQVLLGMTQEQVAVSWGEPRTKTAGSGSDQTVWKYGDTLVVFTGDQVTAIEPVAVN